MTRIFLLLALLCLLCFTVTSKSVDTFEADIESLNEAEIESEHAEHATAELLEDLGAGDYDATGVAAPTGPTTTGTTSSTTGTVEVKDNDKHRKASSHAASALKAAAKAHEELAAHHAKIKEVKASLKKLQKKTKSLTDAAEKATKDAELAASTTHALKNEVKPNAAPAVQDDAPKVGASSCVNSGASWVNKYPTSRSLSDLVEPFRSRVTKFITDLKAAGASVSIAATYRPVERAYLMHYSSMIAKGQISPSKVPPMAGVNICWNWSGATSAAKQMAAAYGIAYPPALTSRHTQRLAVDMNISWSKTIKIGGVTLAPGNGQNNAALNRVAANTYKVYKLASDPPHWSSDGH